MGNNPWQDGYNAGVTDHGNGNGSSYDNQYKDFDAMDYQQGYEQGHHQAEIDSNANRYGGR